MMTEIYYWIESRTGVSYDFNQELIEMSKNVIFFEPEEFQIDYQQIKNELSDCCRAINEYRDQIPDDLPRYDEMKRLFVATVLDGVTTVVNDVLSKLSIKNTTFNSMYELDNTVSLLCELCDLFRYNSLEDIMNNGLFDRLNAENDNAYTDMLEIVSSDITNMYYVYDSIVSESEE